MEDFAKAKASWKEIAEDLGTRIATGEFAPGEKIPSGDRLARELGVSRNVVHRAIEELQRQRVVVRRQGSGTVVAGREVPELKRIALLMDSLAPSVGYPSNAFIQGIQDRLGERAHLVIAQSKGDLQTEVRQLQNLSGEMDGIVCYPIAGGHATETVRRLRERGYPLVAIDRRPDGAEIDAVFTEDRGAARTAVSALLGRGHRRIGFLSFRRPRFQSVGERFEGYRESLQEMGVEPTDERVRWLPVASMQDTATFLQIVQDTLYALVRREEGITALFCVEDEVALAVAQACTNLGLDVPGDLEVATFSDWVPASIPSIWNFHRLVQRKADIGRAAVDLLLQRLAEPGRPTQTVRVPADFYLAGAGLIETPPPSSSSRLA